MNTESEAQFYNSANRAFKEHVNGLCNLAVRVARGHRSKTSVMHDQSSIIRAEQKAKRRAHPQSWKWDSSLSQELHGHGQQSQNEPHGVEDGDGGKGLVIAKKVSPKSKRQTFPLRWSAICPSRLFCVEFGRYQLKRCLPFHKVSKECIWRTKRLCFFPEIMTW